jgi:hypothetical protein
VLAPREDREQVWRLNVVARHAAPKQIRAWYQASLRRCRPPRQRKLRCGTWRLAASENARPVGRRGLHPPPFAATAQSRLLSKLDLEIAPGRGLPLRPLWSVLL